MNIVFGSLKYLFKNLWYVLLFAIVPAVFLALCLDLRAISITVTRFLTGSPQAHFLAYFRALSILRYDLFGGICTLCAFVSCAVFMALMLCLVEKHMRLGKRTLNGAFTHFGYLLLFSFVLTLILFVLFEVWALALSAVMFAISAIGSTIAVYVLDCIAFILLTLALLYVITVFYLWFPCKQVTGGGNYHSFLYSYRLMTGVRGRLVLSLLISFLACFVIIAGLSFLPNYIFYAVCLLLYIFAFLNFGIRMETVYFATDKLDREDLLRSYREL